MNKEEMENGLAGDKALAAKVKEPGFWREIWQQIRLVYYLVRDPEVPFYLKILPLLAVGYVLFPFDFLNDFAPLIGQVDDVTALLVGAKLFIEMAPPAVVARHMQLIRRRDGYPDLTADESAKTAVDDVADAIIIDADHEVMGEYQAGE